MTWIRRTRGRPPHADILTPAEWRVLEGIRDGLQNMEIADRLDVSVNTVRTHVSSILAKLDLPDRRAIAAWEGAPAPASTRVLDRLGLFAPWVRVAATGMALSVAAGALWVALDGGRGGASVGVPSVTPTPSVVATEVSPTASPTTSPAPSVAAPYRLEFAAGEPIDVSPAVLFIDPETGTITAWVFGEFRGEFGVSPAGDYIIWPANDGFHLLRTDTGDDRLVDGLGALPVSYSANADGFLGYTHNGGMLSWFDAHGNWRGDLQIGVDVGPGSYTWGRRAVATAGYCDRATCNNQNMLSLWTRPVLDNGSIGQARTGADFITRVPDFSQVFLRYSHEGDRLALVTSDAVRVFGLTGKLLWEVEGRFWGNPRWSPDDVYLYVSEIGGTETAHLFTADGAEVLRFHTGYAGGCGGDVWLNNETFQFGQFGVSVEGDVEELATHHDLYIDLAALGVTLARSAGGYHQLHYGGDEYRVFLDDGTVVVSTPSIGHGGCASGVTPQSEVTERLERPPYED